MPAVRPGSGDRPRPGRAHRHAARRGGNAMRASGPRPRRRARSMAAGRIRSDSPARRGPRRTPGARLRGRRERRRARRHGHASVDPSASNDVASRPRDTRCGRGARSVCRRGLVGHRITSARSRRIPGRPHEHEPDRRRTAGSTPGARLARRASPLLARRRPLRRRARSSTRRAGRHVRGHVAPDARVARAPRRRHGGAVTTCLRATDGRALATPADRWLAPLAPEDEAVLTRAMPPVLDVGCGPGRHVLALSERGVLALGIDITPAALDVARRRGAPVLARSVFESVPGAGRWASALLLDGNVGIGGAPEALLERVAALLEPRGIVLVELEPPGESRHVEVVQLDIDGVDGPWFPWSALGSDELSATAAVAGLIVEDVWAGADRWFGMLRRA